MVASTLPALIVAADYPDPEPESLTHLTFDERRHRLWRQFHSDCQDLDQLISIAYGSESLVIKIHDMLDSGGHCQLACMYPPMSARHLWMIDHKYADIPPTVRTRIFKASAWLQPRFTTVKTESGLPGMSAALEAAALASPETAVVGVGPLTSLDDWDSYDLYNDDQLSTSLRHLERAYRAGIRALVVGMSELEAILQTPWGKDETLTILVPGLHLNAHAPHAGQKRSGTLENAIALGGPRVVPVIGRSIMATPFPARGVLIHGLIGQVKALRDSQPHQ